MEAFLFFSLFFLFLLPFFLGGGSKEHDVSAIRNFKALVNVCRVLTMIHECKYIL